MRQINKTQRRLAAGAFLVVAAPVALGSVAYACQTLATLHANPASAAAGTDVTLFGKNYSADATFSDIQIRMDSRTGPVLKSFAPAATLNGTLTIPAGTSVGEHTLIATQSSSTGVDKSGTPGRATVTVTAAATSGRVASAVGDQAPATATAATPSAAQAVTAPSASVSAPTAAPAAATSTASVASVATPAAAPTAPAAAAAASPAVATAPAADTAAPTVAPAPALSTVNSPGLVPVSSGSASSLPSLVLAGGLALVLLSLAAFFKSGRKLIGGHGSPLAG